MKKVFPAFFLVLILLSFNAATLGVDISISTPAALTMEEGITLVPIIPVCELLGINYFGGRERFSIINVTDDITVSGSLNSLIVTVNGTQTTLSYPVISVEDTLYFSITDVAKIANGVNVRPMKNEVGESIFAIDLPGKKTLMFREIKVDIDLNNFWRDIAFYGRDDNIKADIYQVNIDNDSIRRITYEPFGRPVSDSSLSFDPTMKYISYIGSNGTLVRRVDDPNPRQILPVYDLYSSGILKNNMVYISVFGLQGETLVPKSYTYNVLSNMLTYVGDYLYVSVSSDAAMKLILEPSKNDKTKYDLKYQKGEAQPVTIAPFANLIDTAVTDDGKGIYYIVKEGGEASNALYFYSVAANTAKRIFFDDKGNTVPVRVYIYKTNLVMIMIARDDSAAQHNGTYLSDVDGRNLTKINDSALTVIEGSDYAHYVRPRQGITVVNLLTGASTLYEERGNIYMLDVSHDAKKIAYVTSEAELKVIDLVAKENRKINMRLSVISATFAEDGSLFVDALPEKQSAKILNQYTAPTQAEVDKVRSDGVRTAIISTSKGNITVELYGTQAPLTVANFIKLAENKFYDGLLFHRVVSDFIIQSGDPLGNGMGGPGYTINLEISPELSHVEGALAMARDSDPDSAGSQFYITLSQQTSLNRQYAVFGKVLRGMDVAKSITVGDKIIAVNINQL